MSTANDVMKTLCVRRIAFGGADGFVGTSKMGTRTKGCFAASNSQASDS